MSKYIIYSNESGEILRDLDNYKIMPDGSIVGGLNGEDLFTYDASCNLGIIEISNEQYEKIKDNINNYIVIDNNIINKNQLNINNIKSDKISELDSICTQTIYEGTDITLSTGETQHFTLDEQDQANLAGIGLQLGAGAEMISWHQDDITKPCQFYTAEDAQKIINTLTVFKSYHITYFRDLRIYVNGLENVEDVEAIYYGYHLPDEAKSDVLKYYEGLISDNVTDKAVE